MPPRSRPVLALLAVLAVLLQVALSPVPADAQARRRPPDIARESYLRGLELVELGDLEAAVPLFETAYQRGQFKNALWNLAQCLHRLGRPTRALVMLTDYKKHPKVTPAEISQAERDEGEFRGRLVRLSIRSDRDGAQVSIDGTERGRTPLEVTLDPGSHVVEVASAGFVPSRQPLQLSAGEVRAIALKLTMLPARLIVASRPAGAEVLLAGQPIGRTPIDRTLPAGPVELLARLPEHRLERRSVVLGPGQSASLQLDLQQVRATLAVSADVAEARVQVDARDQGRTPLAPRSISPGTHTITVARAGFDTFSRQLDLRDGDSASITVVLRRGRLHPAWFAAGAAVTVGFFAAAGALLARSDSQASDFVDNHNAVVTHRVAPVAIAGSHDLARQAALASDRTYRQAVGLFVAGGVAAAASGVLAYFTRWSRSDARVIVSPTGGGISLGAEARFP